MTSRTGYWVHFGVADFEDLPLVDGYHGEPLREGHGAPLRLVARARAATGGSVGGPVRGLPAPP